MTRVLIVDDEPLLRSGLRLLLHGTQGIEVVGEAGDGAQALALLDELTPDVLLMDIRMPVMNGIEALRALQGRTQGHQPSGVVMLTAFDTDEFILDALGAGALGFLLKSASPQAVVAAVLSAGAGHPPIGADVVRRLVDLASPDQQPAVAAPPAGLRTPGEVLSEREVEVAELIAEGRTNGEIAAELYLAMPTVKTHVGRIMDKLGASNRVQVAVAMLAAPPR